MIFARWAPLALVGIGVVFAQEGNGEESRISELIERQRQPPQTIVQRSESKQRHAINNHLTDKDLIKTADNDTTTSNDNARVLVEEFDWFNTILARSYNGFSLPLSKAPTSKPSPSATPKPSQGPIARPTAAETTKPTRQPSTSPILSPITDSPTLQPSKLPTTGPIPDPASPPVNTPSSSPTTLEPTELPTERITDEPTAVPTDEPTAIPTGTPTLPPSNKPTNSPTESPTGTPSSAPTETPTLEPTAVPTPTCLVDVEISCVWATDGVTDCKNIPIPGACEAVEISNNDKANGVPLSTLSFLYDYAPCTESLTQQQQPEEFFCIDQGNPSTELPNAQIMCMDDNMNVLVDDSFTHGSVVLIQGHGGGDLGQGIQCEISEVFQDGGTPNNRLQEMRITTAVLGNFYLQDRYGSFLVESCDVQRCVEPVIYTYSITNVQSGPQTINELTRNRNGDMVSLLPLIPGNGPITQEPGETTTVSEDSGIDLCHDDTVETMLSVQTEAAEEQVCRGSAFYSVVIEVECRVDLDVVCKTEDGQQCNDLDFPRESCTDLNGEALKEVRLRYQSQACETSMQTNSQGETANCRDFTMPLDRVQITCAGGNDTNLSLLVVIETEELDVGEGDTIIVRNNDGSSDLPSTVSCEVRSSLDPSVMHQAVSFETSQPAQLFLQDSFGSLVVEACSSATTSLDCLATVCFEYRIQNVGTNDAVIFELSRLYEGDTSDLLDLLSDTALPSGQSTAVIEKSLIDLCSADAQCVSATVQSSGQNELVCGDADETCFGGRQDCEIALELTCVLLEGGRDCTELQGEQYPQCSCSECPSELRFVYTSASCPDDGAPGLLACLDENSMPTDTASVIISAQDDVFFSSVVNVGDEIIVVENDAACLPSELMVVISESGSATSSQVLTIDTSCAGQGITLLDGLGGVQFTGYSCPEESINHNCFVDSVFEVVASNVGPVDLDLTTFEFSLNEETVDILGNQTSDDLTLVPSGSLTVRSKEVLERCIATNYMATSTVAGNEGECASNAEIIIGPIEPGTRSPTAFPVPGITPSPTTNPSEGGTFSPTENPTVSITDNPTESPVVSPSNTPTPALTEAPTDSPTVETVEPTDVVTGAPIASPPTEPPQAPTSTEIPLPNLPSISPTGSPSQDLSTEPPVLAPTFDTPQPTEVASDAPSETPTLAPTAGPETNQPTQAPVDVTASPVPPVATPTDSPGTAIPTSECTLEINTECIPPEDADSCEAIRVDPVLCEGRPEAMQFLYEGGNCQNSFNVQSEPSFVCEDFNGGAPTSFDESSYVVITDIRGSGVVYFNDWVRVGDLIEISPGDGSMMEGNQNITIYSSNTTGPESILQTLVFHSSCANNPDSPSLFLKDRFGSMQVVGFTNGEQGEVSCFIDSEIQSSISVPSTVSGQPVTITSVTTTFSSAPGGEEGVLNFTSDLSGQQINSDTGPAEFDFTLNLNLTARRTYSVFTAATGVAADGRECSGSDLYQFSAGQPPPPLFPTLAPTASPTLSLSPTPDLETTPCDLTAVLTCIVIRGGSNTCQGLQNPSEVTCTGQMMPSSLTFQYTGDRCPVNPQNYECTDTGINTGAAQEVLVELADGESIIASSEVRLNEFITAEGEYGPSTTVTLYALDNGVRGDILQVLVIPTDCDSENDLTLLNRYGALELTGFTNAASGEQGIEAQIELLYAVENSGFETANVESALVIDAFDGGPFEVVDNPIPLEATALTILFRNEQILNLRLKEQLGRQDTFFLSVRGKSASNSIDCTDTAQFSF